MVLFFPSSPPPEQKKEVCTVQTHPECDIHISKVEHTQLSVSSGFKKRELVLKEADQPLVQPQRANKVDREEVA